MHVLSTPPAFVLSQDQTLRKNLVFFRYAASRLRRVSSAHTSALPDRDFAVPCLAKKSLRFFSTPDTIKGVAAEKIALQFTESHDWLFFIFGYDSFEPHKEIVDCFCSSQSMFHQDLSRWTSGLNHIDDSFLHCLVFKEHRRSLGFFAARSSQAT